MNTVLGDRLFGTAKCAKHIGRDNTLAAKAAKNALICETDGCRYFCDAVGKAAAFEIFQMVGQDETQLVSTRKTCVGIVFDTSHQDPFHLVG